MTEGKRKTIVFGLAGIALVWAIFNSPLMDRGGRSGDVLTESTVEQQPILPRNSISTTRQVVTEDWHGDPFPRKGSKRRVEAAPRETQSFRLSAISKAGSSYMAVVNGSVLSDGSLIEGWRVTGIDDKSVVLSNGSSRKVLKLGR